MLRRRLFFLLGTFWQENLASYVLRSHLNSTIQTPQILELSGIGRREVLNKIGVPVKVELPGVGENLQDHPYCGKSLTRFVLGSFPQLSALQECPSSWTLVSDIHRLISCVTPSLRRSK